MSSDFGIELRERALGEVLDQVIEAALPAQRAGDDLGGQRAVALVGEVLRGSAPARSGRSARLAGDRAQRVERRGARRRGHGPLVEPRSPGRVEPGRSARRGSRARASAGLPSGCSSLDRQAPPWPVAT